MTSAAYDSPNVVWVAAGGAWANDSVSCPRSGEVIVREQGHWYSTGADFKRPSPHWWFDDDTSLRARRAGPADAAGAARHGEPRQRRPGRGRRRRAGRRSRGGGRGGVRGRRSRRSLPDRPDRRSTTRGSCWPRTRPAGRKRCRWWTSTRPGWSSRSTGRCPTARTCPGCGTCASSTSRRPPSWRPANAAPTWRCASGYAGVEHTLVHDTMAAIASCPPGRVEVVANYTAFLQLQRSVGAPWLTQVFVHGADRAGAARRDGHLRRRRQRAWCCANGCGCAESPPRSSRSRWPTRCRSRWTSTRWAARRTTRSGWPPGT